MSRSAPPTVVIVGRPNVGKSTVFNRITGSRRSIVGNEPGITRDRIYLEAEWHGRRFKLIDTGGMIFRSREEFPTLVEQQARKAIEEAAHVIFVVDGRSEITATDRDLADLLRRSHLAVSLAVNKCDTQARDALASEFYELGIPDVFPISAEHNRGIGDLLNHATEGFPVGEAPDPDPSVVQVAIIGRPNVGKSTLLNKLTGTERAIVSPTPGTTRDAVDEEVVVKGARFQFVDTAGIRRKGKTKQMAEKLSVVMAQRHIRLADVVLMLLDPIEGVTALDGSIAGYADSAGKAVVIVVNKWDLAGRKKTSEVEPEVRRGLKFLDYAPLAFVSATKGQGIKRLFPLIHKVYGAAHRRVATAELNRFLEAVDFDRVSYPGFRKPTIRYVTQPAVAPPTFVFFTKRAGPFHFSFQRFLRNQLRRAFDFEGTPLVVKSKSTGR